MAATFLALFAMSLEDKSDEDEKLTFREPTVAFRPILYRRRVASHAMRWQFKIIQVHRDFGLEWLLFIMNRFEVFPSAHHMQAVLRAKKLFALPVQKPLI